MREINQRDSYMHNVSCDLAHGLTNVFVPVNVSMILDLVTPELSRAFAVIDLTEMMDFSIDTKALMLEVAYSAKDYAVTQAIERSLGKMVINPKGQLIEMYA